MLDKIKGLFYKPQGSGLLLERPEWLETLPRHELFAGGEAKNNDWRLYCPPFRYQGASTFCTAYAATSIGEIFNNLEEASDVLFSPLELFYRTGGSLMGNYLINAAKGMSEALVLESDVPTPLPDYWNAEALERYRKQAKASEEALKKGKKFRTKSFAIVTPDKASLRLALKQSPLMLCIGCGKNYWVDPAPRETNYKYYHAVVLTAINPDGTYEIFDSLTYKQGFSGFHRLSSDYEILMALSFIDLPNNWEAIQVKDVTLNFDFALSHYGKTRVLKDEQIVASVMSDELRKHPTLRSIFGKNWTVYINAIAYGGYTLTDLLNHSTSIHRGQGVIFNLNESK